MRRDVSEAKQRFVNERRAALRREQKAYARWLSEYALVAHDLLRASNDLRDLTGAVLESRELLNLARYLAVPPISIDDLDTLTDSCFGRWVGQSTDRGIRPTKREFNAAARIIADRLDQKRALWLAEDRAPRRTERATYATGVASIPAMNRLTTTRRSERSKKQEDLTRTAVASAGYHPVKPPGTLKDPVKDMDPGTYSEKSRALTGTNMDVPVRLRDNHSTGQQFLAIECKVSNSSLNSRKRLLEVNSKRERWDSSGLPHRFRTGAVLAGVFDLARLIEAQDSGIVIFWEHRLEDLTAFLSAASA